MSGSNMPPSADLTQTMTHKKNNASCLEAHLQNIQHLAEKVEDGVLIVSSFGQNPRTGTTLQPRISHFHLGQIEQMKARIDECSKQKHRNIYMPLCVMRSDLPAGKKGSEKDIVAVFGLVADFDDNDAANWANRIPCNPSYVLETSPGRFQVGFLFDKPLSPKKAKPMAQGLKNYCNCDHGTADISHVWRIPGALNWPNKKKVDSGRSPEPWEVRYVAL